jgi:hypothetical protein
LAGTARRSPSSRSWRSRGCRTPTTTTGTTWPGSASRSAGCRRASAAATSRSRLFGGGPRPDRSTPPLPFPSGSEGVDPLLGSPLQFLFDPIRLGQEALADRGLKLGIYELLVGQAVTDAAPGTRSALGSSRFDLRLDALAWRPEGLGTGRFCIQFRQNNAMPGGASDLANSVGSVTALDEPLASISTKLVRCHFSQGFLDDRLTVTVGKVNPEDYIGLNVFASDETSQFLANVFDGNDVLPVAYQAGTVGVVAQALVLPWLYVNAQCVSAGNATEAYFEETFGSGYFVAGEVGVVLSPLDRPGRISFAWCASDENATTLADDSKTFGQGWVFVAQQFLDPELGVWFQAAGATAGVWRSGGRTRSRPGNGCRTRSRRTTGFRSRGRCR